MRITLRATCQSQWFHSYHCSLIPKLDIPSQFRDSCFITKMHVCFWYWFQCGTYIGDTGQLLRIYSKGFLLNKKPVQAPCILTKIKTP